MPQRTRPGTPKASDEPRRMPVSLAGTLLARIGGWARSSLANEHHCAPPVADSVWQPLPAASRGDLPRDVYVCPECEQTWNVSLAPAPARRPDA